MGKRTAKGKASAVIVGVGLAMCVGLASAVQAADGACEDNTFCIGQHPSPTVAAATVASGSPYVHAGIDFEWPGQPRTPDEHYPGSLEEIVAHRSDMGYPTSRPIWPGTAGGTWALVTIWLAPTSGSAWIIWTDGEKDLRYVLQPGDSITVYSSHVELSNFLVASSRDEVEAHEIAEGQEYSSNQEGSELIYPGQIFGTYTITVDLCGDP